MFDNLLISPNRTMIDYPIGDSNLPFADYIANTRALIADRRLLPLKLDSTAAQEVLDANSPFELLPDAHITANKYKFGALLVHGLLDCPFSLKDISLRLKTNGVMSRALLLPGHGTVPSDLLHVSYQDWIQAVRYGIEVMQRDVEKIFLVGYSTGAALSIYHALQAENRGRIAGIILLAPAIRVRAPVDIVVGWHYLTKWLKTNNPKWLYRAKENDYAKYHSITFNAVSQVTQLTDVINDLHQQQMLDIPVLMIMSKDDETISSQKAIEFFSSLKNNKCKLLLYAANNKFYADKRIETRPSHYPAFHIMNFSHVSVPFAMDNTHYGQYGNYAHAAHLNTSQYIYGAYNHIEERVYNQLYKLKLVKRKRRELTYNPDFDYMAEQIVEFVRK